MNKVLRSIAAAIVGFLLIMTPSYEVTAKTGTTNNRYDVEYVKSAGTGVDCVKVWSYTKSKKESVELSKRNAVHAVIFKGYSGSGATKRPLARDVDAESTYSDFFRSFFAEGGEYGRFVTGVGSRELVKVGKEWKISEEVTVNTTALRKYLESHGVIKSLNSGF